MLDRFNRKINYLRISVTDRCNQRCFYCMPEGEASFIKVNKILSFEEIIDFTKTAVEFGIDKVRLTGGEPLVRKNITYLVKELADMSGIKDLAMTTNGILLEKYAAGLKCAGLHRINVSLDTLDRDRYKYITGGGEVENVLKGLDSATFAGFKNIKVNCVIKEDSDEPDALSVKKYCDRKGYSVRFIRQMDMEGGKFWPVQGGEGGKCSTCNRLRLSCDGRIYPCLFSDDFFSIKKLGNREALEKALHFKPVSGDKAINKFHILGG